MLICAISVLLTSCGKLELNQEDGVDVPLSEDEVIETNESEELRGVWLSFFEIGDMSKGKSEGEYRGNVRLVIENIKKLRLNSVFFQVRCFSDAFYKSKVFPSSEYAVENQGDELPYDMLEIFIEEAKKANVSVHAWVNPFRVSYKTDFSDLSEENPAKIFYEENKKTESLIVCEKGIYYNPASSEARKVILSGIKELLNYEIDGIQFDDYFYPDCDDFDDEYLYKQYKKNGGTKSKNRWRGDNLTSFISSVYALIKSVDEAIAFGVSPSAKQEHNEEVFADIKKWCGEEGYIDYVMPQIYYGFKNETMPFSSVSADWATVKRCKGVSLYCGLAPYKCGEKDENAGSGSEEWIDNKDILKRQYQELKNLREYTGFSLYSYSYCFDDDLNKNSLAEIENLTSVII